ncbi:hypothetical protein AYO44_01510 [Planctomycetaceae bacterium SCGC AG-212-F19]|nr:hypothetical protein AYO44_01510 [Planctomycetaceae bacterium SCGC AG-212-F19]
MSICATAFWCALAAGQKADPKDKAAPPAEKKDQAKTKGKGKFTLSKETTYITEPLDKEGYPDYAAALNERLRQGVTPDNNANVLLWKAVGPQWEIQELAKFFEMLGIPAPPVEGDYFVDAVPFLNKRLKLNPGDVKDRLQIFELTLRSTQRPWTSKEYPDLSAWLKVNEKPLALIVEATKRTHFYSPVIQGPKGFGSSFPIVGPVRAVTKALIARALMRAGDGADAEAWEDLLACHRLAWLVGRGDSFMDAMLAYGVKGMACNASLAYLDHARPDDKRLERQLRELQKLPALPELAERVNLFERFMVLDVFFRIDRQGLSVISLVGEGFDPQDERVLDGIDWDPALRYANAWYDRLGAVLAEKDRRERDKQLEQIAIQLKPLKAKLLKGDDADQPLIFVQASELAKLLKEETKERGKLLSDVLFLLVSQSMRIAGNAADRAWQTQDNVTIAFALAWYHHVHGNYPKELAALTPQYLAQVPLDRFSGKALRYRPSANGYLLYSVGVNGKDDEGRGPTDNPPGDDLSVRMPLPGLPRR